MIAYKFLRHDGTGVFTRYPWPLPDDGAAAAWVEAPIYEVELAGEIVEERTKVVASRARLVRRIDAWDDAARDAYTRDCADRAHALARAAVPPMAEWEAVVEPSIPEGPALLGFVAARIAEERDGIAAYHAERARQVAWLTERLGL